MRPTLKFARKFSIIILLISLTSCSYQAEKEYVTSCMVTAIANPLNLINGFIDSLQNNENSKDSYKVNKFRDFCKCGFKQTAKKFNFIEKFKLYYLDIGISDPLYSRYAEESAKSAEDCKYILDGTMKESSIENQDRETQKSITDESKETSSNTNNYQSKESIVSKFFKNKDSELNQSSKTKKYCCIPNDPPEISSLGSVHKSQKIIKNDNLSNEESLWISAKNSMTWEKAYAFCENYPPKGKYILPTTEQLTSIVNKRYKHDEFVQAWTRIPSGQDSHISIDLNDGRIMITGDTANNTVACIVH